MIERVVIVGAGEAGIGAALALRSLGFTGSIRLFGKEAVGAYHRPPLSKAFLEGLETEEDVASVRAEDFLALDLSVSLGTRVTRIDRDRQERGAGSGKGPARRPVARILDHHPVAGIDEEPGAEVDPLLRAVDHHDLVEAAAHPPGAPEIGLEGGAQFGQPARVAVAETGRPAQQHGVERPPPGEDRKIVAREVAVAEIDRRGRHGGRRGLGEHALPEGGEAMRRDRGGPVR